MLGRMISHTKVHAFQQNSLGACRWRNFLSPDIEHPRKSPFTEWEVAVVVLVRLLTMIAPGQEQQYNSLANSRLADLYLWFSMAKATQPAADSPA